MQCIFKNAFYIAIYSGLKDHLLEKGREGGEEKRKEGRKNESEKIRKVII